MRKLILFLVLAIVPISLSSQNTYEITAEQIQTANLIFVEHEFLTNKVQLLEQYVKNLELTDSLSAEMYNERMKQIGELQLQVSDLNFVVKKQKRKLRIYNWAIGGLGCLVLILL